MPTRNRRPFVAQSIRYFERQDYPNRELIVIDDGEESVRDLVPEDEDIRYIRLPGRSQLGTKRNLAKELARGGVIAHWDDDDWMAPQRLRVQMRRLRETQADVCGLSEFLYFQPDQGLAWWYHRPPALRPWLAGGTLVYRRTVLDEYAFPDTDVGEDTGFLWQMPAETLCDVQDPSLYIGLIHKGNTSEKTLEGSTWERRPLDDVACMLEPDRDFYVGLRLGWQQSPPGPEAGCKAITLAAPFVVYDGYGSMAEQLALGMEEAGATVNVDPLDLDLSGLSRQFRDLYKASSSSSDDRVIYFCWPRADLDRFLGARELYIYTMWEGSRLPTGWAAALNRAKMVMVPTRFLVEVCRSSGVTVPIEVVAQGADPRVYHYLDRPRRRGLTTLIVGTVVGRKHVLEGVEAWKRAFVNDATARLLIKSRFQYNNFQPDDERIHFIDSNETTRGIAHWYQRADVLLALGNEGFGLPLVEAMATGLPVIALNTEGQADVCEDAKDCLLPIPASRYEPADDAPFGPGGVRGVPSIQAVVDRLTWVDHHRSEAREMGKRASSWVMRHRDLRKFGPAVLEVLDKHSKCCEPLRRADTFVVPSWGSACGVSEYSRHLAEQMPWAQVLPRPDDLRRTRLLHLQHEPSLWNDADVLSTIAEARKNGVPVLVTEHAVDNTGRSWEGEADVLIAHTDTGVERIRARWPGRRVEHIAHGCPQWFPRRKRKPGRTIGAFGFLEPHKGFWKLLDALQRIEGSDLLLFSHAKGPDIESRWVASAKGLPVRRHKGFLPVEKIAARLADQADVLVFWYDDTELAVSSGAVRVGLASGVPVLTAPVSWFEDVREASHQPRDLVEGLETLFEDRMLREQLVEAARSFCHANRWEAVAEQHRGLWRELERMH